jgi:hypothetical protein
MHSDHNDSSLMADLLTLVDEFKEWASKCSEVIEGRVAEKNKEAAKSKLDHSFETVLVKAQLLQEAVSKKLELRG